MLVSVRTMLRAHKSVLLALDNVIVGESPAYMFLEGLSRTRATDVSRKPTRLSIDQVCRTHSWSILHILNPGTPGTVHG